MSSGVWCVLVSMGPVVEQNVVHERSDGTRQVCGVCRVETDAWCPVKAR